MVVRVVVRMVGPRVRKLQLNVRQIIGADSHVCNKKIWKTQTDKEMNKMLRDLEKSYNMMHMKAHSRHGDAKIEPPKTICFKNSHTISLTSHKLTQLMKPR